MKLYTTTPLKKHQAKVIDTVRSAINLSGGVLIGDEMGLGKTLTTIVCVCRTIHKRMAMNKATFVLVVAPSSVLIEWKCQLDKHLNRNTFPNNKLTVVEYCGDAKRRTAQLHTLMIQNTVSAFVLVSYEVMKNDAHVLLDLKWSYAVLDECHRVKNPKSDRHIVLKNYLPLSVRRIGLSGTPNANHPVKDMVAISAILFPKIPKLHTEDAFKSSIPSELRSCIISRTTRDVGLKLPNMHVRRVELHFKVNTPEWESYNDQHLKTIEARKRLVAVMRAHNRDPVLLQTRLKVYQCAISLLAKVCTHAQISDVCNGNVHPANTMVSTKENYVHKIIELYATEKQEKQKLIVTSCSSSFLKIIYAKCKARFPGQTVCFTGESTTSQRFKILQQWRSPNGPPVLLLSMKAGGVGLTLTDAHRMVVVDGLSLPNPADRDQVIKRIHRMGQTEEVFIDDLCVKGTIDEVMAEVVHPSKRRKANEILGRLPVLQSETGGSTRATRASTSDLCGVGSVLSPFWKKEFPDKDKVMESTPSIIGNTKGKGIPSRQGYRPAGGQHVVVQSKREKKTGETRISAKYPLPNPVFSKRREHGTDRSYEKPKGRVKHENSLDQKCPKRKSIDPLGEALGLGHLYKKYRR